MKNTKKNSKINLNPAVCLTLSWEDLDELGYDVSKIDQRTLDLLAMQSGEYIVDSWWEVLQRICELENIPLKTKEEK